MPSSLQQQNGKVDGPVSVDRDTDFHGMITVGALVKDNVTFLLHGMITGDLTVEKGGNAVIHGTVWNYGYVTIYGAVDAIQNCTPDCHTVIDPKAHIKGRHP
jgi:hypothetical protein